MEQKQAIAQRVGRSRKGTIFTPDSFPESDPRHVSNVLAQLAREGRLVRVAFGVYAKPAMSRFGPVAPTAYEVARAVARRDGARLLPSGTTAENYLGFSEQVPMRLVFLTDGTARRLNVGGREITLLHRSPSAFAFRGKVLPILVLALRSIGQANVTADTLARVREVLRRNPEDDTWPTDIAHAPAWIRRIITNVKSKGHEQVD